MTITKIFQVADAFPLGVSILCLAMPLLGAWICGLVHGQGKGGKAPWKYVYSLMAYWACASGIYAAVVPTYILLFTEENCPDVRVLWYYLPGIIMVLTLLAIWRKVSFDLVPGLRRLYLLIPIVACSIVLPMTLEKHEVVEMSLPKFVLMAGIIFVLLQGAAWLLFRRRVPKAKSPEVIAPQ